jgi:hypothetical protein
MDFKQAQKMSRREAIAGGKFLDILIGIRRKAPHRMQYSSVGRPELPQDNRFEELPLFGVSEMILQPGLGRTPKVFQRQLPVDNIFTFWFRTAAAIPG